MITGGVTVLPFAVTLMLGNLLHLLLLSQKFDAMLDMYVPQLSDLT